MSAEYECPVCGVSDENAYVRCGRSDCPDGRDPRPKSYSEAAIRTIVEREIAAWLREEAAKATDEDRPAVLMAKAAALHLATAISSGAYRKDAGQS